MSSKIGFEMSLIIVEAIRGRCASFMILVATVSEIFAGQTTTSILVVLIEEISLYCAHIMYKAEYKLKLLSAIISSFYTRNIGHSQTDIMR